MARDNNIQTTKMGSFEMAKASDRIKAFRELQPNGKISTTYSKDEDGKLIFRAYIWKEKTDFIEVLKAGVTRENALLSADSDATAKMGDSKAEKKDFEKLETIAVGRALAFLGYLANGQVASSEEMEQFLEHKETEFESALLTGIEYIEDSETIDQLNERYLELPNGVRSHKDLFAAAKAKKEKLQSKKEEVAS